jgi:hypothetical protein
MPVGVFVFAITLVFGGGAVVLLSFSPIGKVLAERLRSRHAGPSHESLEEIDALKDEVGMLRQQLGELAERQDFSERLLAQAREKGLLPGGAHP